MYQVDLENEKQQILKRYRDLLRAWRPMNGSKDKTLIRKALDFAVEAHKDMRRKTGEPYIYHPLEVARIVAGEIGLGETSIVCALLHDVVEDTDYTLADIEMLFGEKVARIIDGLTKIRGLSITPSTSGQAENFKKILLTLSDDVRVILIKLADRLHNMRTLEVMPREKQLKIASETIFLFAPLAHRLGLYAIKSELEDLALKYTEPEIYNTLAEKLKESEKDRNKFINKFIQPIRKKLSSQKFKFDIQGRVKSIYSIWKKMREKEIPFEDVYDLFAVRIIIDTPYDSEKVDCWTVYTMVTECYNPLHNRLRDWISTPKANGYESLHTTVMGPTGRWVEVQIRTKRMNEIAERGYAAHWKYKNAGSNVSAVDQWLNKITELLQTPESNALDFLDDFKLNLFTDEITVFTPRGEMRTLPSNSTALDFAYNIHTDIGNQCIGAKVNHKLVPLSYVLRNGDQVEIITSKKQKPREDWLHFVVTAKAHSRIKEAVKEDKKKYIDMGRDKLRSYMDQLGIEYNNTNLMVMQNYFNIPSVIDLLYKVARDDIGFKELKGCCQEHDRGGLLGLLTRPFVKSRPNEPRSLSDTIAEQVSKKPESLLLKGNMENIHYRIAECCSPIPGDDVVGFMTLQNNEIEIHRTTCHVAIQLMTKYGNRIVKAKWRNKETIEFLTGIKITGIDRKGLINEITQVISGKLNLNIRSFHLETHDGMWNAIIMLYVHDTQNVNDLIKRLKNLDSVNKVVRINRMDEKLS
jgi:guanosine-3',5'-bis(diphosphate) 3'-pyrophosphohydrolase